jgi:hypothetical protein
MRRLAKLVARSPPVVHRVRSVSAAFSLQRQGFRYVTDSRSASGSRKTMASPRPQKVLGMTHTPFKSFCNKIGQKRPDIRPSVP